MRLPGTVVVLNLDRRPDRWDEMVRELPEYDGAVVRVRAVDGADLREQDVKDFGARMRASRSDAPTGLGYVAGQLGCLRSHRSASEMALRENLPAVTVFEDDASWMPDGRAALAALEPPDDWQVLIYGGRPDGKKLPPGTHRVSRWLCAHAYSVRGREAFETLVEAWKSEPQEGDRTWWTALAQLRTYAVVPQIFGQRYSHSDILGYARRGRAVEAP